MKENDIGAMSVEQNPYAAAKSPLSRPRQLDGRRIAKRITQAVWLCILGAFIFGLFHSGDRDPLQWPSAMLTGLCGLISVVLTAMYWLLVVPLSIWLARRRDRPFDA